MAASDSEAVWAIEVSNEKIETTKLYLHVLDNILKDSEPWSFLRISFLYILNPQGAASFTRKIAEPLDDQQIKGKKRLIHSEVLDPVVKNLELWWRNNAASIAMSSREPTLERVTASWHIEVNEKRDVGLTKAAEHLQAVRLYMFGKKNNFGRKLDRQSEYCSQHIPQRCALIVFYNGARIRHLAPFVEPHAHGSRDSLAGSSTSSPGSSFSRRPLSSSSQIIPGSQETVILPSPRTLTPTHTPIHTPTGTLAHTPTHTPTHTLTRTLPQVLTPAQRQTAPLRLSQQIQVSNVPSERSSNSAPVSLESRIASPTGWGLSGESDSQQVTQLQTDHQGTQYFSVEHMNPRMDWSNTSRGDRHPFVEEYVDRQSPVRQASAMVASSSGASPGPLVRLAESIRVESAMDLVDARNVSDMVELVARMEEKLNIEHEMAVRRLKEFAKKVDERAKNEVGENQRARLRAEKMLEEAQAAKKKAEDAQKVAALEASNLAKARAEYEEQRRKASEGFQEFSAAAINDMCRRFDESLVIGEGGFGTVFKGTYAYTTVAVKRVKDVGLASAIASFKREGEVHSSLRHPNIVLLMGHCKQPACLVYEFMAQGSLQDRLRSSNAGKPLSWIQRFEIFEGVCLGLLYLHTRNPPVVHLDIKPANILLDKNLTAKLGDVGLAQYMAGAKPLSFVQMSRVVGTFGYIDPHFGNTGQFSVECDVYSLGQVLWDILVGLSPEGARGRGSDNAIETLEGYVEEDNLEGILSEVDSSADWPPLVAQQLCKLAVDCCQKRTKRAQLQGGVLKAIHDLKPFIQGHLEEEELRAVAQMSIRDIPPGDFICPITQDIMEDPVSDCNGHTYERRAIQQWFDTKRKSPITGETMRSIDLTPNYNLKSLIEQWKKDHQL